MARVVMGHGKCTVMEVNLVADEADALLVKTQGDIRQNAFEVNEEPLAGRFGADVYNRRVLLSLEDSHFIDSSGVGWLLRSNKRFRESGGLLVLHSIPPLAMQVMKVLQLEKPFHLAEDEAAAREMAQHLAGGE